MNPATLPRILLLCLGLLLAGGWLPGLTAAPMSSFDAATFEYDAGHYETARDILQEEATTGHPSANLYYNLGNAHYRLGDKGAAILAYERALALAPSHPEARANLARLRDETGAQQRRPPRWEEALLYPQRWSGGRAYWIAALAFWGVAFGGLLKRRALLWGSLVVLGWAGAAAVWEATRAPLWIVTDKQATARMAPADNSKRAATLPLGSRVRFLLQRGPWVYVLLPDDTRAWLPESAASPVVPVAPAQDSA